MRISDWSSDVCSSDLETVDARVVIGKDDMAGEQLAFHVTDNGAGFPPEYAGKLFRPFQRLHNQEQFDGHGIGLASVKRIIERHGGMVGPDGRPGQGATFRVTLPREAAATGSVSGRERGCQDGEN